MNENDTFFFLSHRQIQATKCFLSYVAVAFGVEPPLLYYDSQNLSILYFTARIPDKNHFAVICVSLGDALQATAPPQIFSRKKKEKKKSKSF